MTSSYNNVRFIIYLVVSAIITHLIIFLLSNDDIDYELDPPKFSVFESYLSIFQAPSGERSLDHAYFTHGLFGWGEKIRQSDILLTGNSHMMFGIDANLLSQIIFDKTGKNLNVVNLGRGHVDGVGLTRLIIDKHDITNKIIIAELYNHTLENNMSHYAHSIINMDYFGAFRSVIEDNLKYYIGLFKYRLGMPRLMFYGDYFKWENPLDNIAVRSISSGDVEFFWTLEKGDIYSSNKPPYVAPPQLEEHKVMGAEDTVKYLNQNWCSERGLKCLYTYIPYQVALDPQNIIHMVKNDGIPFLHISHDELTYYDNGYHLDAKGREKATRRLAQKLLPILTLP